MADVAPSAVAADASCHGRRARRGDGRGARRRAVAGRGAVARRASSSPRCTTCRASGRRWNGARAVERRRLGARAARRRAARAAAHRSRTPLGRATFRHLTLDVDERVLIPRPETEHARRPRARRDADDAGRRSPSTSAPARARSRSRSRARGGSTRVIGTDISLDALAVARANAARCAPRRCARRSSCAHGSLLGPVPERPLRAVVSNPPYIALGRGGARCRRACAIGSPRSRCSAARTGWPRRRDSCARRRDALAPGGLLALEVDARRASLAAELRGARGGVRRRCGCSWISPAASASWSPDDGRT